MAGQESNASLFPVEIRCEHFGFSIEVAFLEVRKRDLRLLFLLNHKNILFLSTWVFGLHRNLILTFIKWGRGNTRNYFRSRSTMQLLFTKYNFHSVLQHLLHHNTSFIASSMNKLKRKSIGKNNPRKQELFVQTERLESGCWISIKDIYVLHHFLMSSPNGERKNSALYTS